MVFNLALHMSYHSRTNVHESKELLAELLESVYYLQFISGNWWEKGDIDATGM